MGGYSALIFLAIILVPIALILIYMRRPHDPSSTPRDSLAMQGKARRGGLLPPSEAADDLIRDEAADLDEKPPDEDD